MPSYLIRTELTRRFDDGPLDPSTAHGPRIRELNPTIEASGNRVAMTLTVVAADLWTAMLTCMTYLNHNSYELTYWSAGTAHPTTFGSTQSPTQRWGVD